MKSGSSSNIRTRRRNRGLYTLYSRQQKGLLVKLYEGGLSIKEGATATNIKYEIARSVLLQYKKKTMSFGETEAEWLSTDEVLAQFEACMERHSSTSILLLHQGIDGEAWSTLAGGIGDYG